ncbi:MAG: GNAT family N-acetyltransferase, partial [Chloroflexi bacterium]|nr:GNAT family N-acetyltransferase [Chloroflexota bacterium]
AERMLLEAAHLGNRHLMAIQWEETPVGVLDFRLRYPDAAAAYLGLILLLPEWRGRGIGTWALDIWETWLDVQTPLERVRTAVPAHLRRAQRFFLRRDYHLTGESYRVPVGEARPRLLVMEKLLGIEPPAEEP